MLEQARGINPALPAIIISGYADSHSIVHNGEVIVLTKPFTLDQMSRAIVAAILPSHQRLEAV